MKKRLTSILLFGLLFVLFAAWGVYAAPQKMALVAQMGGISGESSPWPGPTPFGLVPVGQFGGHPLGGRSDIATAAGTLVYAVIDHRLTVIDASDPYHFSTLGQSEPLTQFATSLGIKDHTVFIADDLGGLILCDVHHPAHPQKLSSYPELKGEINITGDRLYLVDQDAWTTFDIAQPESPQKIGQITFPYEYSAVEFAGNLAYMTDERQLTIFDLSDPTHLQLVGHYQAFPGFLIHEILPQGPWVYLLGHQHHPDADQLGVLILDVSDLAHPLARGSYFVGNGNPDDIGGLALSGHALYVGMGGCGGDAPAIIDVDVSDPDHPQQVQRTSTDDFVRPFLATETRLYARSDDLWIFRRSDLVGLPLDPGTQQSIGNAAAYQIGGMGTAVYLSDGHAIRVLDNTDATHPVESSRIRHFAASYFAGSHAYTSDTTGYARTFYVTDVTAPDACWHDHPLPLSDPDFFDSELTSAWLIAEAQGYAFVGYWKWRDLWHTDIIDVHDLNAMRIVDVTSGAPVDVSILDHDQQQYIVWAFSNEYSPTSILITPLEHPHDTVGRFYPRYGYPLRQIALDGHLLVALNSIPQLLMIDLSDPENPREIGRYHLEEKVDGACTALEVVQDRAYVSCGRTVWGINISDPAHPQAAGLYIASQNVLGLHVRPPVLSLALGDAGMLNLEAQSIIFLPRMERQAERSLRDR